MVSLLILDPSQAQTPSPLKHPTKPTPHNRMDPMHHTLARSTNLTAVHNLTLPMVQEVLTQLLTLLALLVVCHHLLMVPHQVVLETLAHLPTLVTVVTVSKNSRRLKRNLSRNKLHQPVIPTVPAQVLRLSLMKSADGNQPTTAKPSHRKLL